jgi:RNA polymerase-binding protein DksA
VKIEKLRKNLLEQRTELENRVQRTSKHLYRRDKPVSSIFSEQSVEMESRELIYRLDGEGKEEIRQIDRALGRIDNGSYGVCTNCGEDIAEQRLGALPFADRCIACADLD